MDSLAPDLDTQKEALLRRYGAASLPAAGPWNDVIATMLDHRSVRSYKPDAVPEGTLETMIAAAQSAATSSNMQWTSVIATTDPAKKKVLAEIAGNQKHIEQCPLYLCWIADMNRHVSISATEQVEFETMPWLETFLVACIDVALAAQNAVVAAESLGLSTVYIGAMRNDPERVARLFNLPKQSFVVFGLCVGYAAEKSAGEVKPRLSQAAILHHERYDSSNAHTERLAHDEEMMRFSQRHELQAGTWTQRVLNRLGPLKSMNGRERMRAALAALGFEVR
ncbi:MAG TPA: NADPH-dependent oxidoreductase [Reyranella sp.]|nr:NADPH-dependent oxidoreductase [Reyranella sp.]